MAGYEKFVKELGINFEWEINKDTKKLEYRDLTGPEKLLVLKHINFHFLLSDFHDADKLQALWSNFRDIIGDLKLNYTTGPTDSAISSLEDKMKKWFQKFLDLHQAKDVTLYMHSLYAHVPEFLKLYQNLAYYTQQGMEKYNNTVSKDFFRSSNHREVSALKQLFLKKTQNTAFGSYWFGKGEGKLQLWTLQLLTIPSKHVLQNAANVTLLLSVPILLK